MFLIYAPTSDVPSFRPTDTQGLDQERWKIIYRLSELWRFQLIRQLALANLQQSEARSSDKDAGYNEEARYQRQSYQRFRSDSIRDWYSRGLWGRLPFSLW
ncbi:hypothetical protein FRB94_001062 [Tulasnella sp. JGI-2019a]|nr:hypothetical protein FRB94_001062 [Tulasnella sp. JGI-2019a]